MLDGLYGDIQLRDQQFAESKTLQPRLKRISDFYCTETGISVAELEVEDQLAEDELIMAKILSLI